MGLLTASNWRAALPAITGDAMADSFKGGQLLMLRRSLRLGNVSHHVGQQSSSLSRC